MHTSMGKIFLLVWMAFSASFLFRDMDNKILSGKRAVHSEFAGVLLSGM